MKRLPAFTDTASARNNTPLAVTPPPPPPPPPSPRTTTNNNRQQVLLSSVESMEASDAQVGSLRTRLLDSVAQKREVLGEESSTQLVRSSGGGASGLCLRDWPANCLGRLVASFPFLYFFGRYRAKCSRASPRLVARMHREKIVPKHTRPLFENRRVCVCTAERETETREKSGGLSPTQLRFFGVTGGLPVTIAAPHPR